MGLSQFRVLAPPEILKRDVEGLLLYEFNGNQRVVTNVFPKGLSGIVFHHQKGDPAIESIQVQSGRKVSPPTSFLYGPVLESSVMSFVGGSYRVIQVVLKPHALKALFDINALALRGTSVELNEFSSEDLNEQLINAHCAQDQTDLLINFLVHKLEQARMRDDLIDDSMKRSV